MSHNKKAEASRIGAALASFRRKRKYKCVMCGAKFEAVQNALYCSNACKQAAWRKRHPDRVRADRRAQARRRRAFKAEMDAWGRRGQDPEGVRRGTPPPPDD